MLVLQLPLMTIKQLINIAALRHFRHMTAQKSVQLQGGEASGGRNRGASPPNPLTRGSAPGPRWGTAPGQTHVIGSCSALVIWAYMATPISTPDSTPVQYKDFILMISLKVDQKFQAPLEKISGCATVCASHLGRALSSFKTSPSDWTADQRTRLSTFNFLVCNFATSVDGNQISKKVFQRYFNCKCVRKY